MKTLICVWFFISFLAGTCYASQPYDFKAGVVLKEDAPCFYSGVPLVRGRADYLKGAGLAMRLFDPASGAYVWSMWRKRMLSPLPDSMAVCIPYGLKSPDQNDVLAQPLVHDRVYIFEMGGETARQAATFCIRQDNQGRDYLSAIDEKGECAREPLSGTPFPKQGL